MSVLRKSDLAAVDGRLPTPLYHQIFLLLRDKIHSGQYPAGSLLPGEHEIGRLFAVSRITAKRALDEMAAAGLAVREVGRGTRVTFQSGGRPVHSDVDGLLENLFTMGSKTQVALLEFDYEAAGPDVALALECGVDDVVQRAVRLRSLKGEAFSYLTTFVPEAIGRSYDRADLAHTALLALLERGGVEIGSARQTITATLADNHVGPALGVAIGSPLLRISRVVRDQAGLPVEYIIGLYRPDRYQFNMDLDRVPGQGAQGWSPAITAGDA